mgnify:CR=1 FL=1
MTNIQDQEWKNELQSEIHQIHHKLKSITNKLEVAKEIEKWLGQLYPQIEKLNKEIEELKKTLEMKND